MAGSSWTSPPWSVDAVAVRSANARDVRTSLCLERRRTDACGRELRRHTPGACAKFLRSRSRLGSPSRVSRGWASCAWISDREGPPTPPISPYRIGQARPVDGVSMPSTSVNRGWFVGFVGTCTEPFAFSLPAHPESNVSVIWNCGRWRIRSSILDSPCQHATVRSATP